MKIHTKYVCQQCGYVSPGQMGKCPECGAWGSFVESIDQQATGNKQKARSSGQLVKPLSLSEIKPQNMQRILTGIGELDRVLGGGIVPGSVVLISGDPGIGKSTLLLAVSDRVGGLYVSGEESAEQIKIRAERLRVKNQELRIMGSVDVDEIIQTIAEGKPKFVVIDSIQTMETEDLSGAAGSVGQVRESAQRLHRAAKDLQIPMFIIGHVTKEGNIAGPKVLEHLVDTVLYFEGERYQNLRILRSVKNRFGATDEVGVFEMEDTGIKEVKDPSGLFLGEEGEKSASAKATAGKVGSCVVCTVEGARPILAEIQALAVPTQIPVPRRVVSGVDYNRVQLLCAILQKYLKLPLYASDVFVSVTGGIKILEPAADLGIALAIISSVKNIPLGKTCAIGEVGLLGEIRRVNQLEKRIREAKKMGMENIMSYENGKSLGEIIKLLK